MQKLRFQFGLSWVVVVLCALPQSAQTQGALPTFAPKIPGVTEETNDQTSLPQPSKVYSYGTSKLSVLFLPVQIDRMTAAVRTYENTNAGKARLVSITPDPVLQPVVPVDEPASYPVYYLASIAYDSPDDWSLWMSGYKITSAKNETDVTVVNVTRDSATFSWNPTFSSAIERRRSSKRFASIDEVRHRLALAQNIQFDPGTGIVTFTLRPNQSFNVGYLSVFEGFVEAPTMPSLDASAANVEAIGDPSVAQPIQDPAQVPPPPPPAQ